MQRNQLSEGVIAVQVQHACFLQVINDKAWVSSLFFFLIRDSCCPISSIQFFNSLYIHDFPLN